MPNPNLDALVAEVKRAETVDDSVLAFVAGVPGLIQAAVDKALALGATATELEPLGTLATDLKAKSDAIVAAINSTPA